MGLMTGSPLSAALLELGAISTSGSGSTSGATKAGGASCELARNQAIEHAGSALSRFRVSSGSSAKRDRKYLLAATIFTACRKRRPAALQSCLILWCDRTN